MDKKKLLDEATQKFNADEKQKKQRGRPRKGTNRELAATKVPSGDKPAALEEGTRAYRVSQLLLEGNSIEQVAEILSINRANVMQIVRNSLGEMYESAGTILLNWVTLSILRTEEMQRMLWESIKDDDGKIQLSVLTSIRDNLRLQKEIVGLFASTMAKEKAVGEINSTLPASSKLYHQGVIELNKKYQDGGTTRPAEIVVLDDVILDGIPDREHD